MMPARRLHLGFGLALAGCVLGVPLAARAAVPDDDTSVAGRLQHAERLANQRERDAAIAAYRALLDEGVGGAGVHYNLGTLLMDDASTAPEHLGEAILMLKRAAREDPRPRDVWHNLAAAQALTVDRQSADAASAGPPLGARFAPDLVRWLFGASLGLLGALLCAEAARTRFAPASYRVVVRSALLVADMAVLLSGAAYGARRVFEGTVEAVVVKAETPARKGPDALADTAFVAHAGLSGVVTATEPGFVRLQLDNGLEAWVARDAVGIVTSSIGTGGD